MKSATDSPIATSQTWEALLQALAAVPEGRFVATVGPRYAKAIVAAPAAVARWIAIRAPQLSLRPRLRLLVIGAEKLDAVDGGRWYQLIPMLLGRQMHIEVTLVGDRLESAFSSPAAHLAPDQSARPHCASLAIHLDEPGATAHDLAFLFHPGFQKHQGWLRDGSLARLRSAGVPVVAAAYEPEESEVDRRVAECHGFSTVADVLVNPFFIDFGDSRSSIRWGHALWQFGSQVPPLNHVPDAGRLSELELLARMVMHSIGRGVAPSHAYGERVEFRAGSVVRTLVHVFDALFMDMSDGRVLAFRAGALDEVARVSMDDVAAYPGDGRSSLDRALWAAGIKARALLHLYERAPDADRRGTLARAMHASLQDAVDRVFDAT